MATITKRVAMVMASRVGGMGMVSARGVVPVRGGGGGVVAVVVRNHSSGSTTGRTATTTTTTTTTVFQQAQHNIPSPPTVHRSIESIRAVRRSYDPSFTVGFVPTMGALHEGHLSLIREAREKNDVVISSIFVNPAQFGRGEDLDRYPRPFEDDCHHLANLRVDHIFAPTIEDMYGPHHVTYVDPQGFDDIAEGRSRPGHFRGVATIVTKLLNIIRPTSAYFGQKDAAQCVLIRRIVHDLDIMDDATQRIEILPTVRETDGLAMSSRNAYLTESERHAAPIVYRSLCAARDLFLQQYHHHDDGKQQQSTQQQPPPSSSSGGRPSTSSTSSSPAIPAGDIRQLVESVLRTEPLVTEIQYVAVDSPATMQPLDYVTREDGAIVSLACRIGQVRLIDNIILRYDHCD